jgi:hypothetical protein
LSSQRKQIKGKGSKPIYRSSFNLPVVDSLISLVQTARPSVLRAFYDNKSQETPSIDWSNAPVFTNENKQLTETSSFFQNQAVEDSDFVIIRTKEGITIEVDLRYVKYNVDEIKGYQSGDISDPNSGLGINHNSLTETERTTDLKTRKRRVTPLYQAHSALNTFFNSDKPFLFLKT